MSGPEYAKSQFDDARACFKPALAGAVPKDLFVRLRWDMAGAHIVITEGLANVYEKADTIKPEEQANFAHYALLSLLFLEAHHTLEETILFPMLEPEFTCPALEEHHTFAATYEALEHYILDVLGWENNAKGKGQPGPVAGKTKVPYDAAKLRSLIEALLDPLFTHLKAEIGYLDPEKVRATGLPVKKLETMNAACDKFLQAKDPFLYGMHGLLHVPGYTEWPPAPNFVKNVIGPYLLYWKHKALWKFVPDYKKLQPQ